MESDKEIILTGGITKHGMRYLNLEYVNDMFKKLLESDMDFSGEPIKVYDFKNIVCD